jgi:hypothetical protein
MDSSEDLIRSVRIISLLDAAEKAGLIPLPILHLHTLAYYSNVLSPVWNMPTLEGKILKRHAGPFYPVFQHDLDRMVGMGVIIISDVSYLQNNNHEWRLEGVYRLNRNFSDRILHKVKAFEDERIFLSFLQELAYAISALNDNDLSRMTSQDATYGDPVIDFGDVVDFAEWRHINYSANAARRFEHLLPKGAKATPGEMLHLFVRHLNGRLQSERSE